MKFLRRILLKYFHLVYLISRHPKRDWGTQHWRCWNTAKTFLPKPLTICLMTANDIFNYVRKVRNRLNFRRKNCKYLLQKKEVTSSGWILKQFTPFFPCLSQISPAILAWLPQRVHGRIVFSIEHLKKNQKKQNCFNEFRSLSSTYYLFYMKNNCDDIFDSVAIIHLYYGFFVFYLEPPDKWTLFTHILFSNENTSG